MNTNKVELRFEAGCEEDCGRAFEVADIIHAPEDSIHAKMESEDGTYFVMRVVLNDPMNTDINELVKKIDYLMNL